jgi:hypothetical protein
MHYSRNNLAKRQGKAGVKEAEIIRERENRCGKDDMLTSREWRQLGVMREMRA